MKSIELFIEDKRVDLFGDEGFTLSFSISELTEIGKKGSGYSKEITMPANDNNNRVFTSLFDITIEGGFNPISRKRAVLYVDGVALMNGYFKLNSINIKDNEFVTYKGILFEEQTNFINAIEGFDLNNLVIPLSGETKTIRPPYTQEATFNFSTRTVQSIAEINSTTSNYGIVYSGLTFSTGTWGTETTKNRTGILLPGVTYNPTTVTSYKATSDQNVELNLLMDISRFDPARPNMVIRYYIIKSDYNNPIGTAPYTDIEISSGLLNFVNYGSINITNNIPLLTNDEFRIEIYETTGNQFKIDAGGISGKISSGVVDIKTGLTINPVTIIQTTNNVQTSDDGIVVFPLIDYGERYKFETVNFFNLISTKNTMFVNADVMRPWVFVKHVWDAIFEQAGFTYQSQFLNSDSFKRMIIGGGVNDDDVSAIVYSSYVNENKTDLKMELSTTNDLQTLNSSSQVIQYDYKHKHMTDTSLSSGVNTTKYFVNDILADQYYTYNPSTRFINVKAHSVEYNTNGSLRYYYGYELPTTNDYGVFPTASVDGKYRLHSKLSFTSHPAHEKGATGTTYDYQTTHIIQIQKLRIGSYKYYPTSSTAPTYDKWEVVKENRVQRVKNTLDQEHVLEVDEVINLKKGDMLRVIIIADANREGYPTNATFDKLVNNITLNPDQDDTFVKFYRVGIANGETFTNASTLLPKSFKQKDFILELSKMFNLYFEVDKENPKSILIEPRDTYYETGKVLNFEKKIDYSKDFNISILSHDYPKNQIFKYKDDSKDYLSTQYASNSSNELVFGSYNFESPNEYNFDQNELELKFSPSYLQQVTDPRIKITKIHDPKIYDTEATVAPKPNYKIDPRIMFYKKIDLGFDNYQIQLQNTSTGTFTPFTSGLVNTPSPQSSYIMLNYGYAGHLNDPFTPTFDLNWYTDFNYLPGTTGTTNNLFNIFYKQEMIELTDQTSRKVECFVDLKPLDIVNLRFSDIYYFKKEYWRLISISDYNTSSDINQTTKCTFIKVVRAQTNRLIDYQAFGFLGLAGGTAGGLTGTPLDQNPKVGIGGGTDVVDGVNWDLIDRINDDKNKLKYQINITDTPIFMPQYGDNAIVPFLDIVAGDVANLKDITITIDDKVNKTDIGGVLILTDGDYPAGSTISISGDTKRILIQNDPSTFTGTSYSNLILPSLTGITDGYQLEIVVDTLSGSKFTVTYKDEDNNEVNIHDSGDLLVMDDSGETGTYRTVKYTYWSGTGKYLESKSCVC